MSNLQSLSHDYVRHLIDFAPAEAQRRAGFGEMQLEGCVAAFNMLARNRCVYLADEVGMGKTYVALGVMGLLRHMRPTARIVVLAPRENIQRKWVKELRNFIRSNWKVMGNRVKTIQGTPAWEPVFCQRLTEFGHEVALNPNRDFFLRMTSFSLAVKEPKARRRLRRDLRETLPWAAGDDLGARSPDAFIEAYGRAFNALVPPIDLLVVDEAHNLKHGFGPRGSIRNRLLAHVFGRPNDEDPAPSWYGPRVQNLMLLSATPFEDEYGAVQRQLDVFGFGAVRVAGPDGADRIPVRELISSETPEEHKRKILGRVMLRRTAGLRIADELYTKNMYRREWRRGGMDVHDDPIEIHDPRQRLVVALVQKKVAEILQDERFQNSFQIGMLSSFESFLQSVGKRHRSRRLVEEDEGSQPASLFDGDQDATEAERRGVDTEAIQEILESYRERFREPLPHPKLDAAVDALEPAFVTGDKALVFVRRVATVDELAAKLDATFDGWLQSYMEDMLPDLGPEIRTLFERYEQDRIRRPGETLEEFVVDDAEGDSEEVLERRDYTDERDPGSAETFFSWFFRGQGPARVLSGAAFQRNRLASASSVYATIFEDDHVAMLLDRPEDVPLALAAALGTTWEDLGPRLRSRAYAHFRSRSRQQEGYPRLLVFEAYQAVALEALESSPDPDLSARATTIRQERHREVASVEDPGVPPAGFPTPEPYLGVRTFFTELVRRQGLRERLWPDDLGPEADFLERFRRQEQRRELLSALARLGRSFVDLYLLAIGQIGGFDPGGGLESTHPEWSLIQAFLDLLEQQAERPGLHAFRELADAADAFDTILAVNFPEVPQARLEKLAAIYGATLQRQVPVGRMSGGVNKRLVRQFRMPGYPVVLVTTDVLQEGEDLHTFCRRVVHYGISWTPSAMEQRTGRVDRIGGLAQRLLDGATEAPSPDRFIQVYYPHLRDTVEVLQVRRVLTRLNRFLRLIHRQSASEDDHDSRIDLASALLEETIDVPQLEGRLESAFPVCPEWLIGEKTEPPDTPDVPAQVAWFEKIWTRALELLEAANHSTHTRLFREATVDVRGGEIPGDPGSGHPLRQQRVRVELRSQAAGDATLLRCASPVGMMDLSNASVVDDLYDAQQEVGFVRVCSTPDARLHLDRVSVERDIPFHLDRTEPEELAALVRSAALAADRLEELVLAVDRDEALPADEVESDA